MLSYSSNSHSMVEPAICEFPLPSAMRTPIVLAPSPVRQRLSASQLN